jgi:hypothetical protein
MNHAMIDLETLDVRPSAAFPSIAITQFDIDTGMVGQTLYRTISLESLFAHGLTVGASTLKWWMEQDREVCRLMFVNVSDLKDVLCEVTAFIHEHDLTALWGNSAKFDLGILENAYRATGIPLPWGRHNEQCYRTKVFGYEHVFNEPKPINAHDPRVDCLYQIKKLCAVQKYLTDLAANPK